MQAFVRLVGLAVALALVAGDVAARSATRRSHPIAGAAAPALERLRLSIERARLDNGLRVVIDVDHSAPSVAIAVVYRVGARDEQVSQNGFCHWIAHAMFGATHHLKAGEQFRLVRAAGGRTGSVATRATTTTFEVLPQADLALGLWLEAERMRFLSLDSASLDRARSDLERERRTRSMDQRAALRLGEIAFEGDQPEAHDPLGSRATLAGASLHSVQAFHDRHFSPGNAVLSIAGDVDADQVMSLVHRYFDAARSGSAPPGRSGMPPHHQSNERLAVLHESGLHTPELWSAWVVPPAHTRRRYALSLALRVLSSGPSSRLRRRFAYLARSVSILGGERPTGAGLVGLRVILADHARMRAVEKSINNEVFALKRLGPRAAELRRAKAAVETDWLGALQSNLHRALELGRFEALHGDARLFTRELSAYMAVTPRDVQRAVAEAWVASRHTTIEVYPLRASPGTGQKRSVRRHRRHRLRRAHSKAGHGRRPQ